MNRLRLKYGLRWRSTTWSIQDHRHWIEKVFVGAMLATIVILFVRWQYDSAVATKRLEQTKYEQCQAQVREAHPGAKGFFFFDNGTDRGYGKTAAVCQNVELMDI